MTILLLFFGMILMFLFLKFLRKKESVATQEGGKDEEGMWEQRVFLVSRKKINFRIKFKNKYWKDCSLGWRGDSDLLIPPSDANNFWFFLLKK